MRSDGSLRHRIIAAYVLLALVLCAVFAGAAFFTVEAVEREFIYKRLTVEFDRLIARQRQGISTDLPVDMQLYRGSEIPQAMGQLAPGFHEISVGDNTFDLLVGTDAGERLILLVDDSGFESIETGLVLLLTAAFLSCVLLALLLGRMTASRVIAPLTALADAVQRDAERDALPSLDSHDEVGMLARAFAARTAELHRFLIRERLFTGDVSHELRTPLTVILGAAELLVLKLDQPQLVDAAERIRRTASEASQRVTALLLLSRAPETIGAPRIALRPLVQYEMERCRPLLAEKPVDLRLDAADEAWVFARPELAAIAVSNLVRNACQFTERGAVIVRLTPEFALVEDTGTGLPQAVRARLFERFVRGRDEHATGSGLGLAIVKRVAEHLGWQLYLEDRAGGGSRFILTFHPS